MSPWYRGQKRADWPLLPSLYRIRASYDELKEDDVEDEIREEFIVRAPIFSDFKPAGDDDWEWYFLMLSLRCAHKAPRLDTRRTLGLVFRGERQSGSL